MLGCGQIMKLNSYGHELKSIGSQVSNKQRKQIKANEVEHKYSASIITNENKLKYT